MTTSVQSTASIQQSAGCNFVIPWNLATKRPRELPKISQFPTWASSAILDSIWSGFWPFRGLVGPIVYQPTKFQQNLAMQGLVIDDSIRPVLIGFQLTNSS